MTITADTPRTGGRTPRWKATTTFPEPPKGWKGASKLEEFIDAMIDLGQTGQIFGEHGIGKTATFFTHIPEKYPDTALVFVPAANLTPDDLLVNTPVRDPRTDELVLRQLIMRQLRPGTKFVLLIDDALQAGETIQSQLMQVACNWTLGEYDLRELGCIGVFLTDNESLTETATRRSDLAILDRMVTVKITATDTSWRIKLAERFPHTDLSGVFKIWTALSPTLRQLLSPRTLEHILDCALAGFPLQWGLPLLNGERLRLVEALKDGSTGADRTDETLDRIASALGIRNPEHTPDAVRRVVREAVARRWAVLIQGPPGCGKTEVVREVIREELGHDPLYFSLPVTNVEDLCAPVPTVDGSLDNLLAARFTAPGDKVIVWDEYNRPKDKSAFAKLMEITQEWSIAGRRIPGLRAQIALQNPPYHLGRKMLVARNNIAQATRFTASLQIQPEDIPANEWLIATYGPIAETVLEWWKSDIDDEGREWITKRTLERLIKLHRRGMNLEMAKVYLGDGEYAPVPLGALEARLADKPRTGLGDLAANLEVWERKLRAGNEVSGEGTNDTDVVHQVLANAELSQLREHIDTVARLLACLPAKLRSSYLVGQSADKQRFWIDAFAKMPRR
ncbi:AAA family ATPase [Yinghuangia sp. ASG 101]|uniref:AAA family ATPase n=1 Tax=Yinghuangia sp. ASG 101 TaxID=2896848 RepID=UPI001E4A1514|nr:AAA family ATPase [Yinghuangia sp. ASG 101]UGQ09000.1 AAA family ATPase [Yinghuangia sp. ASG 101]